MTKFQNLCTRGVALRRLSEAGWMLRDVQTGGDYEDFVRSDGKQGLLLVDFALGRFILDEDGSQAKLLTHCDDAEDDPEFSAILHALYEGEVVA
jgi:hypothetical protein